MNVSELEWTITLVITLGILLIDMILIARRPHVPSMREIVLALSFYIGLSIAFGLWVWHFHGRTFGLEFFAGWLTEYSLSADNLFIFILIMSSFAVPAKYQQEALMVGIVLALVFRGIFIAIGAAAIAKFTWVFYLFGFFLIWTAWKVRKGEEEHDEYENALVSFARRRFNLSEEWRGLALVIKENGRRAITPMALVIIALGTTDLLFALDSIPAIFGLTNEPYIVFTANVFALMGLRQLFFLIGGLLRRLIYLSQGLAFLLAFIGFKLLLHALRQNTLPFLNGGKPITNIGPVPVFEIPILVSLGIILSTLAITTVVSLIASRRLEAT